MAAPRIARVLVLSLVTTTAAHGQIVVWSEESAGRSSTFSPSLAALGDLDGDGCDEFVVGVVDARTKGPEHAGAAEVRSGGDGHVLFRVPEQGLHDGFGWPVAAAGDVDGDGTCDLALAAPLADHSRGRVLVVSGRTAETLLSLDGEEPGAHFGWAVTGAGDVNRDGRADLAIGAPHLGDDTGNSLGAGASCVVVVSGADGSILRRWTGSPNPANSEVSDGLGFSLASGNADGDGCADLLMSRPGSLTVDLVSGADGQRIRSWQRPDLREFGNALDFAGDLDGDGREEVLIGAPKAAPPGGSGPRVEQDANGNALPVDTSGHSWKRLKWGAVLVMASRDGQPLHERRGTTDYEKAGSHVGRAGDLDGDGTPDFVYGTRGFVDGGGTETGALHVLSGHDERELFRLLGAENSQAVFATAPLRHSGPDGRPGLAVVMFPSAAPEAASRLSVVQAEAP